MANRLDRLYFCKPQFNPPLGHQVAMEPGVKKYLLRIANTMSLALLWMLINATAGIKFELAIIADKISTANILFYCWFVISLAVFLWWVVKTWSKPIDFNE